MYVPYLGLYVSNERLIASYVDTCTRRYIPKRPLEYEKGDVRTYLDVYNRTALQIPIQSPIP